MGILSFLKRIDHNQWFVCHACLMQQNHDPLKAIFYNPGPREDFMGRTMYKCPRCSGVNTRSFQQLREEGSDHALFGLERIVRSHPRHMFEVKPVETQNAR